MSWYDTLNSTPVILTGTLGIAAAVYASRHTADQAITQAKELTAAAGADGGTAKMAQAVCCSFASYSDSDRCLVCFSDVTASYSARSSQGKHRLDLQRISLTDDLERPDLPL